MAKAIERVLIAAGGTGGHVFPALAVAQRLQASGTEVVWLGTRRGIESSVVPQAGIEIGWLDVTGVRGKSWQGRLLAPWRVLRSCWQAWRMLKHWRPSVVLGMGGFVAGPAGVAARLCGVPLVIHEQNAVAGTTNRLLSRVATRVLEAFPGTFPISPRVQATGNPVRDSIAQQVEPWQRLQARGGRLRVLVLGGSQGAQVFNDVMPRVSQQLAERVEVWHQAGKGKTQQTVALYQELGVEAKVEAFVADMSAAYTWADVVVSRSGAMSVSELAAAGCASILVPFPYAIDDHQRANGCTMVRAGGAILIPQSQLDAPRLADILAELAADRDRLQHMAKSAYGCAKPAATDDVVTILTEIAT